jgi:hypothetical protein
MCLLGKVAIGRQEIEVKIGRGNARKLHISI